MKDKSSAFSLLNPKTWPLFQPIPAEHDAHVKAILVHELFWNVRLALTTLLMAMGLYHYLISEETNLRDFATLIAMQAMIGIGVLTYYTFAENLIRSLRWRLAAAGFQALLVGCMFGIGFFLQVPILRDPYRIATVYTLIVGVTGAASFTFTVSPLTFLAFCVPFVGPLFAWLWFSSPAGAGKILSLMVFPYFTSIFFLVLREYRRRVNLILAELHLKREQQRSESLLLNILPHETAQELKAHGRAEPVEYDVVTVLFTDFVGFTRISEKLTPRELVDELDKCFSYFDQVTEKYGLEKLKTIGDSFMCAGGLPTANNTHAIDCCLAALEIQAFMNQMKDIKHQQGFDYW